MYRIKQVRIIVLLIYIAISFQCLAQSYKVKSIKPYIAKQGECISYLIEASRNDSLFFIFSDCKKTVDSINGSEIKERCSYNFLLKKVFPREREIDTVFGHVFVPHLLPSEPGSECYGFAPDDRHHNTVYKALNTNGKSFLDFNQDYDETIRLIFDYNSIEHEIVAAKNGHEVANRVYTLLYETSDDVISKEKKMDLLHTMILLDCFATRAYRSDMLNFDKNFDIISKHPEYCFPLMCGYYASMEQFDFIDIDSFENKIAEFVPASYEPYYREYIQIVRRKRAGEKFSEKESPFYALMLQLAKERKLNILNSHEVNLGNGYFWLW